MSRKVEALIRYLDSIRESKQRSRGVRYQEGLLWEAVAYVEEQRRSPKGRTQVETEVTRLISARYNVPLLASQLTGNPHETSPLVSSLDGLLAYLIRHPREEVGHDAQAVAFEVYREALKIAIAFNATDHRGANGILEIQALRDYVWTILQLRRDVLGQVKKGEIYRVLMIFLAQTVDPRALADWTQRRCLIPANEQLWPIVHSDAGYVVKPEYGKSYRAFVEVCETETGCENAQTVFQWLARRLQVLINLLVHGVFGDLSDRSTKSRREMREALDKVRGPEADDLPPILGLG